MSDNPAGTELGLTVNFNGVIKLVSVHENPETYNEVKGFFLTFDFPDLLSREYDNRKTTVRSPK